MNRKWMLTPLLATVAVGGALVAPRMLRAHTVELPTRPTPPLPPLPPAPPLGALATGTAGITVTATPDLGALRDGVTERVRVRLDLQAPRGEAPPRVPTDLVLVVDRSGSMSGDKMEDARAAAHELVGQLGEGDRFVLVGFDTSPSLEVRLGTGGPDAWHAAIDRLSAGGGTGMAPALSLGLSTVRAATPGRARRMVLISDGLPDDATPLPGLARDAAAAEVPLTTVGIGLDYDEALMQRLADLGTGNFHWTTRGPELAAVLGDELDTARETVARGVTVRLDGPARIVDASGYPVQDGAVVLGSLFGGQHRSVWVTVEVEGRGAAVDPGALAVSWTGADGGAAGAVADLDPLPVVQDDARYWAAVDRAGWEQAVVQDEYNDVRAKVSASVQQGDLAAAKAAIGRYRDEVALANGFVGSQVVTDNLAEAARLQAELDALEGQGRDVLNPWAKGTSNEAYKGRRVGQSKSW